MAVRHRGSSKYNTVLVGSSAMLGDNGRMYVSQHRGQRGLQCSASVHKEVPAEVTGPDQRISGIPGRVFRNLITCLSKQSPLHNDWRMVADKALNFSQEDVDSLAYQYRNGPMEGVLRKMNERKMTVGQLVKILCEIQRLDAVAILTDAGYPRDLVPASSTQEERRDGHENQTDDDQLPRTSLDGEQDCQDKTPDAGTSPSVHKEREA